MIKLERNLKGRPVVYVAVLVRPSGTNQVVADSPDNAVRALWAQSQRYTVPFEELAEADTRWMKEEFEDEGWKLVITPMPLYMMENEHA